MIHHSFTGREPISGNVEDGDSWGRRALREILLTQTKELQSRVKGITRMQLPNEVGVITTNDAKSQALEHEDSARRAYQETGLMLSRGVDDAGLTARYFYFYS